MPARRYNCACGKKRYRDEPAATAAAEADERAYQVAVAVYRCPGGLAWHVTAHGFTPEALTSVGRRLAFELVEHRQVDLDDFCTRVLRSGNRTDDRRLKRVRQCANEMATLGLVRREPGGPDTLGRLLADDDSGLRRVVQVGLDTYRDEKGGSQPFLPTD